MQPADNLSARTPDAVAPAETAPRISELALKAVSQGVIITGPDTRILSANPAFLAITGYAEAEVLGRSCKFLQGPDSAPQTVAAIRLATQNQQEFNGEILNYRKDGTPYWNELTISPVHDRQGTLTHFIGINRDITAHKDAEAALRQQESYRAKILDSVSDHIALLDEQGVLISVNRVWRQFALDNGVAGQSNHWIGLNYLQVCASAAQYPNGDEALQVLAALRKVLAGQLEQFQLEYPCYSPNERRWFLLTITRLAGTQPGAVMAYKNITQSKEADTALRESEAKLRKVVDGFGPNVFVGLLSLEGHVLLANQSALVAAGLKPADVLGHLVADLPYFTHSVATQQQIREAVRLAAEGMPSRFDLQIRGADESTFIWLDFSMQPVRNEAGKVSYLVPCALVITERKAAEEKLRKSEQRYTLTLAAVKAGLWDWHLPSGDAYYSPLYYTMLGYADGAYPANYTNWRALVHPADIDRVERDVRDSLESGRWFAVDMRMKTAAGAWCWVSSRGNTVERDTEGKVLRMVGTLSDITARKQAEAALQASESALLEAQRVAQMGNWSWDITTNVVHWSAEMNRIYDRDQAAPQLSYEEQLKFYAPESAACLHAAVSKAMENGTAYELDLARDSAGGNRRWITARGEAFRDASGRIVELRGTAQDITTRKLAEADIHLWKNRYEAVIQASGQLLYDWDPGSNTVVYGGDIERVLGYRLEEMTGGLAHWLELVHPEDRGRFQQEISRVIAGKQPFHLDYRIRRKDGTCIFAQDDGYFVLDQLGNITRMVGFVADITARKEMETALRASDQRFRDLVDFTDGIVWEADAITFNFSTVSNNAERLLGYPVADWLQPGFWASHIHPEDRDRAVQYCIACTGRLEDHDFEYRFNAADGRIVWLRDIVRVVSENEKPRWLRGLMIDITAQKEVSAALQISLQEKALVEDQLRQSQKLEALGTLAGGIAHDFNNILAGISGFNSLAHQAVGNPAELLDYLGEIDRASQRAAKLIQQILAFSRADNHTLVPTQIRHIVAEAVQLLRATLPSSIVFNVSLATDLPPVLGNATQLHQVVMNLGANAGYAMRENGGSLGLRLESTRVEDPVAAGMPELPPGPCVQLTVSDTGCGMDGHTMRRVFDPFFTTKSPGEGTGLGLSVLHGIVRTHHGAIRLTSELGQGTTFTIILPAIVTETIAVETAPATIPLGQGQRILFVDDEEILTRLGALLLRQLGYVAESESSVRKALTRLERDPQAFDLVLTDQTMPDMSGLEFATRLHTLRPDLPVLIASGYSIKLTPQQIQAAGVKEVLAKPYTKESLAAAIHRQLKNATRK